MNLTLLYAVLSLNVFLGAAADVIAHRRKLRRVRAQQLLLIFCHQVALLLLSVAVMDLLHEKAGRAFWSYHRYSFCQAKQMCWADLCALFS